MLTLFAAVVSVGIAIALGCIPTPGSAATLNTVKAGDETVTFQCNDVTHVKYCKEIRND